MAPLHPFHVCMFDRTSGRTLGGEVGKTWREWDGRTLYQDVVGPFQETKAVRRRRYHPPKLTPAAELLPLSEFSSTSEFLQQAQRRYTSARSSGVTPSPPETYTIKLLA